MEREDYIKEVDKKVRDNGSYEETDLRKLKEADKGIKSSLTVCIRTH